MFSLVLQWFCSHLTGAEAVSSVDSAQLSAEQRAKPRENSPGWPSSLGKGLWAQWGVQTETSLPSQTSSDVRAAKRGLSVCALHSGEPWSPYPSRQPPPGFSPH